MMSSPRVVLAVGPHPLSAELADQVEAILSRCAGAMNLAGAARNAGLPVPAGFEAQAAELCDALLARMGFRFDPNTPPAAEEWPR